ncbi:unnamed protein product [Arabidopsis lyrata]|uniref:Predicted protein n=1 Tax=Arabidopsis lyrata subsp. lyrata TaxID=81972 RepID=D7LQW2_ARALL|nr:predicted protein [Arabidopsis lyrata subsp. lyrata]CAH8266742.1 unnamed protein product [Arabidopsis lyrata]
MGFIFGKLRYIHSIVDIYGNFLLYILADVYGHNANVGATDNQLYAYFIEASAFRIERRLKNWNPSSKKVEKLIKLVSATKRAECRVMRWAMGEESVFLKARDYDQQSASRAFSRTIGLLLVFLGFWELKRTASYAWDSYKEDFAVVELNAKLLIISKESAAKMKDSVKSQGVYR